MTQGMTQETTRRSNAATMSIIERSQAIGRAQRALKTLEEHPRSSKKELGHAREHLNACYSRGSGRPRLGRGVEGGDDGRATLRSAKPGRTGPRDRIEP